MMDDELKAIGARLEAATPGPWKELPKFKDRFSAIVSPAGDAELGTWMVADTIRWSNDADLIAHAPIDIRALLDEVERLRCEINAVDQVLACRTAIDGIPDRIDKIIHALNTAAKAEPKR